MYQTPQTGTVVDLMLWNLIWNIQKCEPQRLLQGNLDNPDLSRGILQGIKVRLNGAAKSWLTLPGNLKTSELGISVESC